MAWRKRIDWVSLAAVLIRRFNSLPAALRAVALLLGLPALAWALSAPLGHAQDAISEHGAWIAYTYKENGAKVCYAASRPTESSGTFKKRGEPYAIITRRPTATVAEEISVTTGYPLKEDAKVELSIDGTSFSLFSRDQWAWAADAAADKTIAAAMERGSVLTVKGESRIGSTSIDSYSLKGFAAARKALAEACP
jgi:hypothetical protein